MSSRRLMTRSFSGEGRTNNGDDGNGTSRPSGVSYISNVRPEISASRHRYSHYRPPRSTLCSVMAQLTEETQPFFETTLKSKAVSETCNVKFSCVVTGHPTPQVLWYKDDMQLDRYCGLPKYEIFRDGQNHSLHIYNCTVDDAAIYQVSATNTKGIVSCSGVLEVGVMNEYNIHERYFAKIKQKAESKRRELEGKENQGPGLPPADLSSVSPERPPRKRRSPMEPGLSPPSSMEDEGVEEICQTSADEAEARVQETKAGEVADNTTPATNGAAAPIANGQAAKDNGDTGNVYMYDSVKKTFTMHQPKSPFAKKKKKISNNTGNVEVETPMDVQEARGASEEAGAAPAFVEASVPHRPPEVVMEAEKAASSKVLASNGVKVPERCQRAAKDKALPIKKAAAKEEITQMKRNVDRPPQIKQSAVAKLPIPGSVSLSSGNSSSSETEHKRATGLEKDPKVRHTEKAENRKLQSPSPSPSLPIMSPQRPLRVEVKPAEPLDKRAEEHIPETKCDGAVVSLMEVDEKHDAVGPQHQTATPPKIKTPDSARDSAATAPQGPDTVPHEASVYPGKELVEPPRESEDASPESELFGHQLSMQEAPRGQKNVSASQPLQPAKVTRAHTQAKRNETPVDGGPLPTRGEMDVQSPQRPPSGGEATPEDNQTPTLHSPEQLAVDKMTQGTWDHSKGSDKSHAAPFTDVQKSPLESQGDGEDTKGCSVSIPAGQSQVETAVKPDEGMEIQVGKKVDSGEEGSVQAQGRNPVCDEGKVEVETRVVSQNTPERTKIGRTADTQRKDPVSKASKNVLYTESEKSLPVLKDVQEIPVPPKLENVKPPTHKTVIPSKTKNTVKETLQNVNESEQPTDPFKEKENPPFAPKVISIAELLRSQIKALGLTTTDSVAAESPAPKDSTSCSTSRIKLNTTDKSPELKTDHSDSKPALEKPKLATQMETAVNGCPPSNIVAPIEAIQKPLTTPRTSMKPIGTPSGKKLPGSTVEVNVSVLDTEKESVPLKDNAPSPLPGTENTQVDFLTIAQRPELTQSKVVCRENKAEHVPMESSNAGIQTVEAIQKPPTTPLTSIKPIGTPSEETLPGSTVEVNVSVLDTEKESVPLKDDAPSPLPETESTQVDFSTIAQRPELTQLVPPVSDAPVIHSLEHRQPLTNTALEMDLGTSPPTKVSSQQNTLTSGLWQGNDKSVQSESPNVSPDKQPASEALERSTQGVSVTSPASTSDQHKEHKPNATGSQAKQACVATNALDLDKQQIDTPHVQSVSSVSTTDAYSKNDQLTPRTDSTSKPALKTENGMSPIPSATPQELASGARRKILIPKPRPEDTEPTSPVETHIQREEVSKKGSVLSPSPNMPSLSPSLTRRSAQLQPPCDPQSPPVERKSPLMNRKSLTVETSPPVERKSPLMGRKKVTVETSPPQNHDILIPKPRPDDTEPSSPVETHVQREEVSKKGSVLSPSPNVPSLSPSLSRKPLLLQPPSDPQTPPVERKSPLMNRKSLTVETSPQVERKSPLMNRKNLNVETSPQVERKSPLMNRKNLTVETSPQVERKSPLMNRKKVTAETSGISQEHQLDTTKPEENKHDPFKAPQVIRKIRGEPFSDALGHLKLWCQFFNVLSDSTIKWYRDEVEIADVKRSAGDETQVALAIVQASSRDSGVYGCTITNEYGSDSTDFLLSADILAGMYLREDLDVGEEIEVTPLVMPKGLADAGVWGNKFFGRIMMKESHVGEGCSHKAWRAKVIYGLEPLFESGVTCIIKVHNPIAYGGKEESNLVEKNQETARQECRIQSVAREYCKIFSAEARVIENFGATLDILPVYLMYRPANTVPYATVEAELQGLYVKYCLQDATGRLVMRSSSEVDQKCCALQHWVHQWTNGSLLLTRLEGVDTKITNVGISVKSAGYQGLSSTGNPKVFEQFVSQHQCNYFCGLLALRPLKTMDTLQMPTKVKGPRSPMLHRKMAPGSASPQTGRKVSGSPRLPRKSESDQDAGKGPVKLKTADVPGDA